MTSFALPGVTSTGYIVKPVMLPGGKGRDIAATCLIATEVDTPTGATPVCWRWLTNRTVTTLEAAGELIEWPEGDAIVSAA